MSGAMLMDFETYAARRGLSRQLIGDSGTHMSRASASFKQTKRIADGQWHRDGELIAKRDALRGEYNAAVARGEIIEPTVLDQLHAAAQGMPELASTQAAQRALAKRAARAKATP